MAVPLSHGQGTDFILYLHLSKMPVLEFSTELNRHKYSGGSSPSVPWAKARIEQPGVFGGHV